MACGGDATMAILALFHVERGAYNLLEKPGSHWGQDKIGVTHTLAFICNCLHGLVNQWPSPVNSSPYVGYSGFLFN